MVLNQLIISGRGGPGCPPLLGLGGTLKFLYFDFQAWVDTQVDT
jgi:hypothetical protein